MRESEGRNVDVPQLSQGQRLSAPVRVWGEPPRRVKYDVWYYTSVNIVFVRHLLVFVYSVTICSRKHPFVVTSAGDKSKTSENTWSPNLLY